MSFEITGQQFGGISLDDWNAEETLNVEVECTRVRVTGYCLFSSSHNDKFTSVSNTFDLTLIEHLVLYVKVIFHMCIVCVYGVQGRRARVCVVG